MRIFPDKKIRMVNANYRFLSIVLKIARVCVILLIVNVATSFSSSMHNKHPRLGDVFKSKFLTFVGGHKNCRIVHGCNFPFSFIETKHGRESSSLLCRGGAMHRTRRPILPYTPGLKPWKMNRARHRPNAMFSTITSKLVVANVLCYAIQVINPSVTQYGAKVSNLVWSQPHRLVTPIFLHGGIVHLLVNTMSMKNIGPEVERTFGNGRFFATYFAAGAAGNILSAVMTPNPSVGASGAVFGLCGAYSVFLAKNGQFFGSSGKRGLNAVKSSMASNLLFGFMSPGIDNWGHIGGALGGALVAHLMGPQLYLMRVPSINGGHTEVIVDKPLLRVPQKVNSPDKTQLMFQRMKRKMQYDRYYSDLRARPWEK